MHLSYVAFLSIVFATTFTLFAKLFLWVGKDKIKLLYCFLLCFITAYVGLDFIYPIYSPLFYRVISPDSTLLIRKMISISYALYLNTALSFPITDCTFIIFITVASLFIVFVSCTCFTFTFIELSKIDYNECKADAYIVNKKVSSDIYLINCILTC